MNTKQVVEQALAGLDTLGYTLESTGITDKVNRHTVLAFVMAEQQNLKGQVDSVKIKLANNRYKVIKLRANLESELRTTAGKVLSPVQHLVGQVRTRFQ